MLSGSGNRTSHAIDVLSNATITTSDFELINEDFASQQEVNVVISIYGPVTGGSPSLQFTLEDLDQVGTAFNPHSSVVFTTTSSPVSFKHAALSARQRLSWTVSGSFSGVYVNILGAVVTTATISPVGSILVDQGAAGAFPWPVTIAGGSIVVNDPHPTIATGSVVGASTSTVTLLAANATRLGATISNNSSNRFLYVRLGSGALPSAHTAIIGPRGYYEVPNPVYVGIITGAWSAGSGGDAQITELTP